MTDNPFTPLEDPSQVKPSPPSNKNWRWTAGAIMVLIGLVPLLVLLVFYYRGVAVTYYMTRNPLQPSSLRMARSIETVLIGNMRDLSAVAETIHWTGRTPPSAEQIRKLLGKSIQGGDLSNFSGLVVIDRQEKIVARMDRRDIDPFVDHARSMALDLFATGGQAEFFPIVVPASSSSSVYLMVAVPTSAKSKNSGGVLAGLMNLSRLLKPAMPAPRIHGTPGRSYLLSGDGVILATSDSRMIGKNFLTQNRSEVLKRFNSGKSGSFSEVVGGTPNRYGSTLLGKITGLAPFPWIAVLEAPKAAIDQEVSRARLNMNLIVFLLVPAFIIIIFLILYKSLRSS